MKESKGSVGLVGSVNRGTDVSVGVSVFEGTSDGVLLAMLSFERPWASVWQTMCASELAAVRDAITVALVEAGVEEPA